MATTSTWLMFVDDWEVATIKKIRASHAAFQQEKYSLQLQLEANPVPFRPSNVLAQLIYGEQRRGISSKQERLRSRNADHLERKLESEVRQHYELECSQACAKWRKLHTHLVDDRQTLRDCIEAEAKKLAAILEVEFSIEEFDSASSQNTDEDGNDNDFEIERQRFLVESEGIYQERFNIQEAFTNQTKKIQADYQVFLDQLDSELAQERQKIVSQTSASESKAPVASPKPNATTQLDKHFKSKVKRHMLVQTAPVVQLNGSDPSLLPSSSPVRTSSFLHKYDMTQANHQLQELEHRLTAFRESMSIDLQAAEERLKDGMQWIARQCAHMFSQLDCKEAEVKFKLLISQQHEEQCGNLIKLAKSLASQLRNHLNTRAGISLPRLPALETGCELSSKKMVVCKSQKQPPRRLSDPVGLRGSRRQKHMSA